ncbi:hypothetical protein CsatA_019752 [Cannabis sativa]
MWWLTLGLNDVNDSEILLPLLSLTIKLNFHCNRHLTLKIVGERTTRPIRLATMTTTRWLVLLMTQQSGPPGIPNHIQNQFLNSLVFLLNYYLYL